MSSGHRAASGRRVAPLVEVRDQRVAEVFAELHHSAIRTLPGRIPVGSEPDAHRPVVFIHRTAWYPGFGTRVLTATLILRGGLL